MTTDTDSRVAAEIAAFQRHYGPSEFANDPLNPRREAFGHGFREGLAAKVPGAPVEVPRLGKWSLTEAGNLLSDAFDHDVKLGISGDFESKAARLRYAHDLAQKLNTPDLATTPPQAEPDEIARLAEELADEKAVVDCLRSELADRLQKQRAAEAELQEVRGLSVWYSQMPETNGKSNFTAILHRGDLASGHTIARSEYPDQVRYHADCVRWLIGELKDRPFILDYDEKLHSGYVAAAPEATKP
jgi:hypothetical protein